jgi:trafficking protein particle complex subunit 8
VLKSVQNDENMADSAPEAVYFLYESLRTSQARATATAHPLIPATSHACIFPFHHPRSLEIAVSWEIPSQKRHGVIFASGVALGAGHDALREVLSATDVAGGGRSMYAETAREKAQIIDALRTSIWNAEMNPLVVLAADETVEHDFENG